MLTANAEGVSKGVDAAISRVGALFTSLGRSTMRFGSRTFSYVLGRAIWEAVDGAKQLAQWAAETANEYERAEIAFQVMTGSRAGGTKLLNDLQSLAVETPFKSSEVVEQAKLLKSYGVETDELIPTIRALGDVAAGTGVDINRLGLAYGQVISKGRFQASELRQFTEAGVGVAHFARTAQMSSSQFLAAMEDGQIGSEIVVKTFQRITGSGGMFFNLMDRQAQTVKGRFDSFIESLEIFVGKVGIAIYRSTGLASFFDGFAKSIQGADLTKIAAWVDRAAQGLKPVYELMVGISVIGKEFLDTLFKQSMAWEDFRKAGEATADYLLKAFKNIAKVIIEVGIAVTKVMALAANPKGDVNKFHEGIQKYNKMYYEDQKKLLDLNEEIAQYEKDTPFFDRWTDSTGMYAKQQALMDRMKKEKQAIEMFQGILEGIGVQERLRSGVTGGISDILPPREELERRTDSLADLLNSIDTGYTKATEKIKGLRSAIDDSADYIFSDTLAIIDEEFAAAGRISAEKFAKGFQDGVRGVVPMFKALSDDLQSTAGGIAKEITAERLTEQMRTINWMEIAGRLGQDGGITGALGDRLRVDAFKKFTDGAGFGNVQGAPLVESRSAESARLLNAAALNGPGTIEDQLRQGVDAQRQTAANTKATAEAIKGLKQFQPKPVDTFLAMKFGGG